MDGHLFNNNNNNNNKKKKNKRGSWRRIMKKFEKTTSPALQVVCSFAKQINK